VVKKIVWDQFGLELGMDQTSSIPHDAEYLTTHQIARMLGVTMRSVQLMVNKGVLSGWRTKGGHRRILKESFDRWVASREGTDANAISGAVPANFLAARGEVGGGNTVLLIEDSVYFQNLVTALFTDRFSDKKLHLASDGIVGLAMAGQLQPDVLIVDILLPGIDGASLINSLRSHAFFARTQILVLTSLNEQQLQQYSFALKGVAVVHKSRMVADLPPMLERMLGLTDHLNTLSQA
jgi:excisionase family DNA binding protein